MADDIVTRLRDYSARGAVFATNDMCWEAAAEIERLRAAGDALAAALNYWNENYESAGNDMDLIQQWQDARRG